MSTDNSKAIYTMTRQFLHDYRKDELVRQKVNGDLVALVLDECEKNGQTVFALNLYDVDEAEAHERDHSLVIYFPDDLSSDDPDYAILNLAIYLAVKLDRYLVRKKANANRSPESRRAAARQAAQKRWADYRKKGKLVS